MVRPVLDLSSKVSEVPRNNDLGFALKRSNPIHEPCRSPGAMLWRGIPLDVLKPRQLYFCLKAYLVSTRNSWAQVAGLTHHRVARTQASGVERVSRVPAHNRVEGSVSPQNPFDNPKLVIELAQAFQIYLVGNACA